MRMAGRFSRRVRAWAEASGVPVVDCAPQEKKFEIAKSHLAEHDGKPGVCRANRAGSSISIAGNACPL